jgi:uncharacterized protein YbjT (DUF2867 family)
MNILIFGASGMVGQGVLHECLKEADVCQITSVGRTRLSQSHPKLQQVVLTDLNQLDTVTSDLKGFDACFFCLGASSSGMNEETYRQLTYDLTVNTASLLAKLNPDMTFVYVSGAGTDSSEIGRSMWARVKGQTENALLKLSIPGVYLFRPGIIQPLHGIESKTVSYRYFYRLINPLLSLIRFLAPSAIVTTDDIGQAMIQVARKGNEHRVLEAKDIRSFADESTSHDVIHGKKQAK